LLESQIERFLVRGLRELDPRIKVLKFTPIGQTGYQDRLVLLPGGIAIFVELKRPGEGPRKLQRYRRREIAALGFATAVVNTLDKVRAFVEMVQRVMDDKR